MLIILRYFKIIFLSLSLMQCKSHKDSKIDNTSIVIDEYFGEKIEDHYRYFENLKDSNVINWLHNQNKLTDKALSAIPKKNLKKNIEEIRESDKFSILKLNVTKNGYYYLKRGNNELIWQLYYRKNFNAKEELLLDPKEFEEKMGECCQINYIKPSWDGNKIAIGFTQDDKEFSEIYVFDLVLKKLLKNPVKHAWPNVLGGVKWLPDNSGFIYTYVSDINPNSDKYLLNTKSVIHKIKDFTNNSIDIFSKENNPELNINEEDFPIIYVDENSPFVLGAVAGVSRERNTYITTLNDIYKGKPIWKPLFKKEDKINKFHIIGDSLFYMTSKNSPNFKICKTSLKNPKFTDSQVIVKEDSSSVITDFRPTRKGIFFVKTKNGVQAQLYRLLNEKEKEIKVPKLSGNIELYSNGAKNGDLWIEIEGWLNKRERYNLDLDELTFFEENLVVNTITNKLKNVVIKEIEIQSYDGTMVPLSIIHANDLKLNRNNRILMTGYGAYGISDKPYMDRFLLNWLNAGGIYAIAHVRGGGEKGDSWHKAGYKATKPNTWKDFIACTEYLINKNYTSSKKMSIWSGSAGGITIGRAITERPDLFKAAVIRVGLLNTLRSEFAPNGKNNIKEFGTVSDSIEFKSLYEMDSYQHIKDGEKYPAVFLTAGMNDARVAAWQPAKFAARLQEANSSDNPILISVDFNGGHGFEVEKNKKNKETTNILSFLLWQTGHPDYQPE